MLTTREESQETEEDNVYMDGYPLETKLGRIGLCIQSSDKSIKKSTVRAS